MKHVISMGVMGTTVVSDAPSQLNQNNPWIKESSELGEVMDKGFPEKKSQIVNMLGNIHQYEEENLFILRALVRMRFLPAKCLEMADEYLLLSVSREARGRNDLVDIAIGKKEFDARVQGSGISNFMGAKK